jgi:hypothetical protein
MQAVALQWADLSSKESYSLKIYSFRLILNGKRPEGLIVQRKKKKKICNVYRTISENKTGKGAEGGAVGLF